MGVARLVDGVDAVDLVGAAQNRLSLCRNNVGNAVIAGNDQPPFTVPACLQLAPLLGLLLTVQGELG